MIFDELYDRVARRVRCAARGDRLVKTRGQLLKQLLTFQVQHTDDSTQIGHGYLDTQHSDLTDVIRVAMMTSP